jgi:hypothetical protein
MLFELADGGGATDISLENTRRAAEWCEYLESHARRVYSCIVSPRVRAARVLADRIKGRKIGEAGDFTLREVYRKGWADLADREAARLAVEELSDLGWIRRIDSGGLADIGRPEERYQVNPGVWQ